MSPRDLLGHGAVWALQLLTGLDAPTAASPLADDGRTVEDLARDLAATTHVAAAMVRQRPADVPAEEPALSPAEAYRLAAANVLMAFSECSALNQMVEVEGEVIDGETFCLRVAALHWSSAARIADAIGLEGHAAHVSPDAAALAAAHELLPGLSPILPSSPTPASIS